MSPVTDQTIIYVPRDAAAISVGADEIANGIEAEAAKRGISIKVVRNGSRGALWLEPLVEVSTPEGRVGYGPVELTDVVSLFDSGFFDGAKHPLSLGIVDEHAWFCQAEPPYFCTCWHRRSALG